MRIETARYQFAHGQRPRGHGLWIFILHTADGEQTFWAPQGMAYSRAKDSARREARRLGAHRIEVAS